MFSLSNYLAMSSEVDEYDVNVVDQILRLGKIKKPTQVVSKDKKRRGTGTSSRNVEGDNDDVIKDKPTARETSQKAVEAMEKSKKRKHTTLSCKIYIYLDDLP
jgi:hypothetical protein